MWIIIKRVLITISIASFFLIAYSIYVWVSYYKHINEYTYFQNQEWVRINNFTSEVEHYDPSLKAWVQITPSN